MLHNWQIDQNLQKSFGADAIHASVWGLWRNKIDAMHHLCDKPCIASIFFLQMLHREACSAGNLPPYIRNTHFLCTLVQAHKMNTANLMPTFATYSDESLFSQIGLMSATTFQHLGKHLPHSSADWSCWISCLIERGSGVCGDVFAVVVFPASVVFAAPQREVRKLKPRESFCNYH